MHAGGIGGFPLKKRNTVQEERNRCILVGKAGTWSIWEGRGKGIKSKKKKDAEESCVLSERFTAAASADSKWRI